MNSAQKQKIQAQIDQLKGKLGEASADVRLDIERRIDELQHLL